MLRFFSQTFCLPTVQKITNTHIHTKIHHTSPDTHRHCFHKPLSGKLQIKILNPRSISTETPLLKVGCQLILQMVASCLSIEPNESNKWLLECLHRAFPTGWIAEEFQMLLAFEALASKTNAWGKAAMSKPASKLANPWSNKNHGDPLQPMVSQPSVRVGTPSDQLRAFWEDP